MKKGFTLIELLAVIVVLAVIALIAVPRIMDAIDESRAGALRQNNEAVIKAAQNYFVENASDLPQEIGNSFEVSLESLIEDDLINDISSPYSSNNCSGYVLVTKIEGGHEFIPHVNCSETIENSLEDGLVFDLRLNGNVLDYSLNNFHGNENGISLATNRFGVANMAYSFDATTSVINLGNDDRLNPVNENQLTFVAWIRPHNTNHSSGSFIRRSTTSNLSGNCSFHFGYNSSNTDTLRFRIGDSNMLSNSTIPNEEWTHVAATFDGNRKNIYINGRLDATRTTNNSLVETNQDTTIGARKTNDSLASAFRGEMDQFKMYDRALSEEEIKLLYDLTR